MVVEAAERFGLAALHQLRGRVGRGRRASRCYLVTGHQQALFRLRIMELSQDGFEIAQADLEHRCGVTNGYSISCVNRPCDISLFHAATAQGSGVEFESFSYHFNTLNHANECISLSS